MKTLLFLLAALPALAQTPNATQTCFFPLIGQTTPQYFRLTSNNPPQCEAVSLDGTVLAVRSASNNMIVSSLSGSTTPNHVYSTVFQWPLTVSNVAYVDPAPPASPFNGQTIWCFSTSVAAFATFGPQLGQFLPTILVEVRSRTSPAAGELPQVLSSAGVLGMNSNSGGRFLWLKSHNACNGNPGIVWTAAASTIAIDALQVPTTLNTSFVVGLL